MGNTFDNRGQAAAIKEISDLEKPLFLIPKVNETSDETNSPATFSVLSYNILADAYKHFFYLTVSCKYLDFNYRSRIIIEEIRKFDTDIICLQEVDRYDDFYKEELQNLGYELLYKQKNRRKDGCVIGIKKAKFEQISSTSLDLDKGHKYQYKHEFVRGNIALISTLRHKQSGKVINVVNTHLFWDPKFEHVKYLQMSEIMRHLNKTFNDNDILIWTGDFNSHPLSNTVRYVVNNTAPDAEYMDLKSQEKLKVMSDIHKSMNDTRKSGIKFDNAYFLYGKLSNDGSTTYPRFTNYTANIRETLDHIFYTKDSLMVKNLLKLPIEQVAQEKALPNWRYPSDHLPLVIDFEFLDIKSKL